MKTSDLVRPHGDCHTAPLGQNGGMVPLLLGQRANTIGEIQRFGKVREAKDSLEPLYSVAFDERPFRNLRLEFPNVVRGHAW